MSEAQFKKADTIAQSDIEPVKTAWKAATGYTREVTERGRYRQNSAPGT